MTPAKIMSVRKIRSVFDKQILNKEKDEYTVQKTGNKFYEVGENVFLPNLSDGEKILGSYYYRQNNR